MLRGVVRNTFDGLEPTLKLKVYDAQRQSREFEFVVDSGFTGYVAVTFEMLKSLGLSISGSQRSILADGQVGRCAVAAITLDWFENKMTVDAQVFDGSALVGTRLLDGHDLRITFSDGGTVEIRQQT